MISNAECLANNTRFREAYSPTVPIEVAWQQIDDLVTYADAGSTPYSSKQVADKTYQLVFNTDIFTVDCREWNKRAVDDKTLAHLKVFFRTQTGSGASLFKTLPVSPTAPHTTPPHNRTTCTYNKRRWTLSQT